ncbi:SsrA-binding protein SmpB [Ahrensia marina]|jgi:SsrA-binding protein|uniref:SsrA-binding protein n=1 Tax=Ahrensia marina TaxID=1514904 RepID=A0A0N0E8K8_9HYPH|nr:SsrA-binding protein SmpB [Ahrensia marina]KPB02362.1 SsrA-binding protein [Ahrensia marina]
MGNSKKKKSTGKFIAENRRARFDYAIDETFEAGIMLHGTEVKSLRNGEANIAESYASYENGEMWLINAHVPEYLEANKFNHEPRRRRKLLLHQKEIVKLANGVDRQGMTIVPLKLYFNDRGLAKLEIALAKGKNVADKRETAKKRDWNREKSRILKEHG